MTQTTDNPEGSKPPVPRVDRGPVVSSSLQLAANVVACFDPTTGAILLVATWMIGQGINLRRRRRR